VGGDGCSAGRGERFHEGMVRGGGGARGGEGRGLRDAEGGRREGGG